MADSSTSDRTLPASPRRLLKAREEGQVARSRDLSHFAAVGTGVALLALMAPSLSQLLLEQLSKWLRFDRRALDNAASMSQLLSDGATLLLTLAVPTGLVFMLAGVLSAIATGGWVWTWTPLMPKFSRLNPLAGFGRLLSRRQLTDTLKSCAIALAIGAVGALYLKARFDSLSGVLALPLPTAISQVAQALLGGLLMMTVVLALTAAIDVPLQRWMHARQLRMSHQEL
jgi:flagellar biosynthetic protein FlhB